MKRILLTLLATLCFFFSASAEIYKGKLGDDITWELDSETGVLDVKGKGLMYSECDPADIGDTKITKINIGEGIKTVTRAITITGYNLEYVEEVNFPSTLKEIGKNTFFSAMALKSITLPDGLITIGDYAFRGCKLLSELHFPSSLTSIGLEAFYLCENLKELYIPSTLSQIGVGAFGRCPGLESIVVDPENPAYDSRNNCNCIIDTKHRYLINGCKNSFIPSGVKTIGKHAFAGVQKSYIEIPSCVQYIDDWAFHYTTSLVNVIFKEGLLEIGKDAFYDSSIEYLYLPGTLREIGDYAFEQCREMKEIQLGPGLKTMGPRAITWTQSRKLEKIYVYAKVPPVVENPDPGVDHSTRVYVQRSSLEAYKNDPFWKRYANYYEMEDLEDHPSGQCGDDLYWEYDTYGSLIIRGLGDMWDYELKPGTLVPTTPWYDFRDEIKRVYLPEDLSHIGNYAFLDLSHVEDIYLPSGLNTIGAMAFAGWTFSSVKIPGFVTEIGTLAFSECENLTDVQLSMSLEKIDFGAFMDCKSLKTITLPSLSYIGNYAFMNCTALESIKLPASLKTLGEMAFYNCSALKSVEMWARGITTLESQTFAHCSSLTYVALPDDLTKIGSSAFWECTSLRTLGLPQSLAEIDKNAFVDCHSLETLRLPASVQSIGDYAFQRCYKLTHIACDATTPPAMGRYVFDGIGHDVDVEHQAPRRVAPTAEGGDGDTPAANVEKVTIYVPAGSVDAYKAADEWKQFIYFKDLDAYEKFLQESGLDVPVVKGQDTTSPVKILRNGRIYIQKSGRTYLLDGTPATI